MPVKQALEYCTVIYALTLGITWMAVDDAKHDTRVFQFVVAFLPVALEFIVFLILI
jgi:hypothetical protein